MVMGNEYSLLERECTLLESIIHPLSLKYEAKGDTMKTALERLEELCLLKNFGLIECVPGSDDKFYCGYRKKLNGERILNRVYIGYKEKEKCYIAFLFWIPKITKNCDEHYIL